MAIESQISEVLEKQYKQVVVHTCTNCGNHYNLRGVEIKSNQDSEREMELVLFVVPFGGIRFCPFCGARNPKANHEGR